MTDWSVPQPATSIPLHFDMVTAPFTAQRLRFLVLTLLASYLTACSDRSSADEFDLYDSAGISIARSHIAVDKLPEWRLSAEPTLEIGVAEGPEAYQLFRIGGGTRLPDGRVAILNAGTQQIRYFDASGAHLFSIGQRGDGPGEFRSASGLWRFAGDSVVTWDAPTRRITVFASDGTLARTVLAEGVPLNPTLAGFLRDGSFLLQEELFDIPEQGFQDTELRIARHSAAGTLIAPVGSFPLSRIGMLIPEIGVVGAPLFEPRASTAVTPTGLFVGTARDCDVTHHDETGRRTLIVRWPCGDRRVSAEAVEAAKAERLASASEQRRPRILRIQQVQPVSELFPAYQAILTSTTGDLRVRSYTPPGGTEPAWWLVFDSDGRMAARIVMPRNFAPLEWGPDYVLGTLTDDMGVERVLLHRIMPPG